MMMTTFLQKRLLPGLCFGILMTFAVVSCGKKNIPTPAPPTGGGSTGGTTGTTIKNFSIVDSKVLDPDGKDFTIKGVNVNGPYWPWDRPTIPDAALITDVWKFNTVRVDCWPEFSIYNSNNTDLDGIISAFVTKKVVAMLQYHNFTNSYPDAVGLNRLTAWWVDIANRYKNNPYVWFNIMNEPGGGDAAAPATWLNVHDAVIKAIRATGAENIIVCDDHGSGQASGNNSDANSGILTYGTTLTAKYKNVMFSLHTYDQWVYADDRLKNFINKVQAKKLAIIVGEYGVGSDVSSEVATSVFKNVIPLNIGRIAWQWTGVDVHQLTTSGGGGGWSIDNTSGAKPGNLSFVGNLVWDDNHAGINLAGAEIIPPAVLVSNTDFEDGPPVNGNKLDKAWINFGTAYIDDTPANVNHGSYSAMVQSGAAGGFGQVVYLQPGATYKMTAWGKNSMTPGSASSLGVKTQADFTGPQTQIASLDFTSSGAEQKSVTFTTPSTLGAVFLFVYKNDTADTFWIDNIQIVKQ